MKPIEERLLPEQIAELKGLLHDAALRCSADEPMLARLLDAAPALLVSAEREARLREALLGVSKNRQHGPCWCSTIAQLYCVAQPQCVAAQDALKD